MSVNSVFTKILFVLLIVPHIITAQEIPVHEVGTSNTQLKHFTVGLLIDSSRELGIDDIVALKGTYELTESRYAVKEIRKNYWFIIKVKNSSSEEVDRIVGFDEVFMKRVDIFYKNDSVWHQDQSGLSVPLNERSFKNRCFLFKVSLEPNEVKTIYLKMDTEFALVTGITIEDSQLFFESEQKRTMAYWCYFGAAIAIFLYNIFLLFQIREKVYLYYVIYAGSFIVFAFLYSGYSQYVISNAKLLNDLDSSLALMGVFATLFTREMLNTKKLSQWIDRVLIGISFTYAAFAVLIPISISFFHWLMVFGIPSVLFLLFTGLYSWSKGVPLAKYFVIAMSGYLIGLILISALNLDLVPYNIITRYGFMIGSFIEISVFSLALGYRVKMLQDEKNIYHLKLLASERGMKESLEIQVAERTEELSTTIEELNTTNEKLHALSCFKEDMMSMIVHDLKTPISTILNVELISHESRRMDIVKYSGYKMMHLVQNILDVYKYESIEIELNKTEIFFIYSLNKALDEISFLAEQKELIFDVDCEENVIVPADSEFIHRVLVNLLSNAVKFATKQSSIKIKVKSEQNRLHFSIHNNGPNIPANRQQQIFERYKQVEKKNQGKLSSTGLGLAFCKMVIKAHFGEIGVDSEEGEGAQFYFVLPKARISDQSYDEYTNKNKAIINLNSEEKKALKKQYPMLLKLSVYEITAFNKVFKIIEDEKLANEKWVAALQDAIYNCNDIRYNELVAMIVEN